MSRLLQVAQELLPLLISQNLKVVFAESCTGGLASASLAQIPGASQVLCGSWVVYRNDSKTRWLGIPASELKNDRAVSKKVAQKMAEQALKRTPEAQIAAAITGHLGPDAPPSKDGLIFLAVAVRKCKNSKIRVFIQKDVLRKTYGKDKPGRTTLAHSPATQRLRQERQQLASLSLLRLVRFLVK